MAQIEFCKESDVQPFAHVEDGAVPRSSEFINIAKETYRVIRVEWALDHTTRKAQVDGYTPSLRATVIIKPI